MQLERYTVNDMDLTLALETDPAVMAELGGPWPADKIPAIHQRRLQAIERGAWLFKIMPGPAGTVSLWQSEWNGTPVMEMGWMVLPAFQGRGLATAGEREVLAMATGLHDAIHAFPGQTNAASNAICRKAGFALQGPADVEYAGRPLHCNHWIYFY